MNFNALNVVPVNRARTATFVNEGTCLLETVLFESNAFSDFSALVSDEFDGYDAQVLTGAGESIRVPIVNWQGTQNIGGTQYLQATFRAKDEAEFAALKSATQFGVYKLGKVAGDEVRELILGKAITQTQTFNSQSGYTVRLIGQTFDESPLAVDNSRPLIELQNVRRVTTTNDSLSIRCDIDWNSAPNLRYRADSTTFTATFVNFFANERDAYMDIGQR